MPFRRELHGKVKRVANAKRKRSSAGSKDNCLIDKIKLKVDKKSVKLKKGI